MSVNQKGRGISPRGLTRKGSDFSPGSRIGQSFGEKPLPFPFVEVIKLLRGSRFATLQLVEAV